MLELVGYENITSITRDTNYEYFHGIRLSDKRKVFIKTTYENSPALKYIQRLEQELSISKLLNISGIRRALELIKQNQRMILILEYVDGVDLQQFQAKQPLSLDHFFTIALKLVDIIGHLHQHHIIHKDIKPANIMIEPSTMTVTLIDLSMSSTFDEQEMDDTSMLLEGTLPYLAPEQTGRLKQVVTYRADFYSLGITFFEMLTGKLPFTANDTLEWIHCHIAKSPPSVCDVNSEIPYPLSDLVTKLLSKPPEDRYVSAGGLKADLEECHKQWQANGKIAAFLLGQQDVDSHLRISQKLYGREEQLSKLEQAFIRIAQGNKEYVLIAGYSGIGKTSLIKETYRKFAHQPFQFVSGKFEQLSRNIPYNAIIQAINGLIQLLLKEPDDIFNHYKEELLTALGTNAQVIINIVPSLEIIIGKQPSLQEISANEAQNRFYLAFLNLIQVFASAEHPLVIFLDDLQWADDASLKLINLLLTDLNTTHFLLIGAYRNNEVTLDHPLHLSIESFQNTSVRLQHFTLGPLVAKDISQLLIDTFRCTDQSALKFLSTLLLEKTEGNPFFINQFLKMLYDDKLLKYSHELRQWLWDPTQLLNKNITSNVVELLINRIHTLPSETQHLLKLAACIGYCFSLHTLAIISEQSLEITSTQLNFAIEMELLVPNNKNNTITMKFNHDRIQQAAHELLTEETRQNIHLTIGKLLLKEKELHEQDDRLFEIVNHLNQSIILLTTDIEKKSLSQYNFWAGIRSKKSTAYEAALQYFIIAKELLTPKDWQTDYKTTFTINREHAECTYLCGLFEQAENCFKELLQKSKDKFDQADVYQLYLHMLSTQDRHHEAVKLGIAALRLFNIKIPQFAKTIHIFMILLKIKWQIGNRSIPKLILPSLTILEYKKVSYLLEELFTITYIHEQETYAWLVCKLVSINLKYGHTSETPVALVCYAFILIHILSRYNEGFAFVELCNEISKEYSLSARIAKTEFVLGSFTYPWKYPLIKCAEYIMHAYQLALISGDLIVATYSMGIYGYTLYACGKPLSEPLHAIQTDIAFMSKFKIREFYPVVKFVEETILFLHGKNPLKPEIIQALKLEVEQRSNKAELSNFYNHYIKFNYLISNYGAILQIGKNYQIYEKYSQAQITHAEGKLYCALTLTACYGSATKQEQRNFLKILKSLHKSIKLWSNWCPTNFEHFDLIISAELSRIQNHHWQTIELYTQAIQSAQKNECTHIVGIANECAGRYFLEQNKIEIAKTYILDAHYAYQLWGAFGKVKQLEEKYPQWFASISTKSSKHISISSTAHGIPLDMLSLVKAQQAISSKITFEKLLPELLHILLENAGAERGMILSRRGEQWLVAAEGAVTDQQTYLKQPAFLTIYQKHILFLIHHIERTGETVVIGADHNPVRTMIEQNNLLIKDQSIFMLPIFIQDEIHHIVYLENNYNIKAFSKERIHVINMLAAQATISLENAELYNQATHDHLTGLVNRNYLEQITSQIIKFSKRDKKLFAIVFLDLDHFKMINDVYGHDTGDKLLIHFAQTMKNNIRESDLAVRLAGDEFVVLLTGLDDIQVVDKLAEKFYSTFAEKVTLNGHEIKISTSMGISLYPEDGQDLDTLLKCADLALYQAKEKGKNQHCYYRSNLAESIKLEHQNEIALQQAIKNNELRVFYQPIIDAKTNNLVSIEALVRWQHPAQGLIEAKDFIALAEKTNLIVPIGEWVIREACMQAKAWQTAGFHPVPITVNISAIQFKMTSPSLVLAHILQQTQLDPRLLELELKENIFVDSSNKVKNEIHALWDMGLALTVDNFDMTYLNLNNFSDLKFDKIKIDSHLVQSLEFGLKDQAVIKAAITLAHDLNIQIVAEGVESETQLDLLRSLNIDAVQGYGVGVPLNSLAFTKWLQH